MARGAPDFGIYAVRTAPIVGLADLGEAVARLGAINVWDRRGFTIFMDDFESPVFRWHRGESFLGELPIHSSHAVRMGSQSCCLSVPTSSPNSESYITKKFPLLIKGKLGFEFWVQVKAYTDSYFYFKLWQYDGTNVAYAELRFDSEAKNIIIRTSTGYEEVLTDIYTETGYYFFLPIKIVIDTDTDKYVRLLVGSVEVDLSAYSLVDMGATTDHYLEFRFGCLGSTLADMWAYVDNIIITQDEP